MNNSSLLYKLRSNIGLLHLKKIDTTTDEGRSRERHRRIAWASMAAAGAKFIGILTALISVPLTLGYLGPERYGMWMTISAIIAMLGFADLGIGNGVLSAIARASGKNDHKAIRDTVANGFCILSLISIIILLLFAAIYSFVPWHSLFNVKSPIAVAESGLVVGVLILCFSMNLTFGMVQKVQMGMQKGFLADLWEMVGSVTGLIGVLLAIWLEAGLPWLALAMMGAPVLIRLVNTVIFFGFQCKWSRPSWRFVSATNMKTIVGVGSLFFVLQVAVAVGYQSDNIVIAQVLNAEAVATYAVTMKIFSLPTMVVGFILMPLWPAYGEAFSRGDIGWIRRTFRRSVWLSLLINVPITFALVLWGRDIIKMWAGTEVIPSFELLVGMGLWVMVTVFGGTFSVLLNGLHIIKFQVVCAILMAVSNIFLSIYLTQKMGIAGAIYGSVLSVVIFIILPSFIYIPRLLRSISEPKLRSSKSTTPTL